MIFDIFRKRDEDKVKLSFKRVRDDIEKLQLMINALKYEKDSLKSNQTQIKQTLNNLISHYSSAIESYNRLHKSHFSKFDEIEQNLRDIQSLLQDMVASFKINSSLVQKYKSLEAENHELKQTISTIKSALANYIKSNNTTIELIINKFKDTDSRLSEFSKTFPKNSGLSSNTLTQSSKSLSLSSRRTPNEKNIPNGEINSQIKSEQNQGNNIRANSYDNAYDDSSQIQMESGSGVEAVDERVNQILNAVRNELTSTEKQLLLVLSHLSTEYNNDIPIQSIIEEFYNGDKRKASTLSAYLSHLEHVGIISKTRRGRETSVSLTESALTAFNQ